MLIVTKPHLECIDEMTSRLTDWKDQILFRFTIGSSSDEVLKFWEPGAPDFTERLVALKLAYERGYETSISCEPMLDNNVEDLIAQVNPYVTDAIWIGKMNHPKGRLKINGGTEEDLEKIEELMAQHDDARITAIYNRYRYSPKIKWKESIKKIVGIEVPTEEGLDI